MSLARRLNRFLDRLRAPEAFEAAARPGTASDLDGLRGHKYCLLVSFRQSGEPVPTPVWFGLERGRAYINTRERNAKLKRIRWDPHVRAGPCSLRGKPLGPLAEGSARVVPPADEERAETALRSNYGLVRRIYYASFGSRGEPTVYVEVAATPTARAATSSSRSSTTPAAPPRPSA
jgi:PPOX class probable F420-dependent enzyme